MPNFPVSPLFLSIIKYAIEIKPNLIYSSKTLCKQGKGIKTICQLNLGNFKTIQAILNFFRPSQWFSTTVQGLLSLIDDPNVFNITKH